MRLPWPVFIIFTTNTSGVYCLYLATLLQVFVRRVTYILWQDCRFLAEATALSLKGVRRS